MKKIELIKGIESSVLGFGCAPILGSVDGKTSRRALELAFDLGINHFDLARSYGYGEAESFVGEVFKNRRDKIILASKFGIRANWKAQLLRPAKPLIRLLRGRKKQPTIKSPTEDIIKKSADLFHTRLVIDSKQMIQSLECSLRALNTDYLDYFLVHEPVTSIENFDKLRNTADTLIRQGKIRAFGLAYMRSQRNLHSSYLDDFDILQFNNSPLEPGYSDVIVDRADRSNIIFSPLSGGGASMRVDEKLQRLAQDFPHSVILCSMYNESHMRENVKQFN